MNLVKITHFLTIEQWAFVYCINQYYSFKRLAEKAEKEGLQIFGGMMKIESDIWREKCNVWKTRIISGKIGNIELENL